MGILHRRNATRSRTTYPRTARLAPRGQSQATKLMGTARSYVSLSMPGGALCFVA
ncbi:hypothetical protein PISMIDRAFT_678826 [Pisolithus microcarpus 441]|uniref:Uncharacterized protein n=1 Tax=Pisolithus microcarpus 441 TaxID=765257 RepID=A0A0C9ZD14_9AGAM|nr:hypothetical protein PISMIDRAFT_678826 [Pisolithus microcarpus 441]